MKDFRHIPVPLQKQIAVRLGLAIAALLLFCIMLYMTRDAFSVLPCIVLSAFCAVNAWALYCRSVRGGYVILHGICESVELTTIKKRIKAVRLVTEEHTVRIAMKQRLRQIAVGTVLTLYVSDSAMVEESDGVLTLHQYLAIDYR